MKRFRFNRKKYRHKYELRVRSYEVDWQGIVHNANYIKYFEVGRIEYFRRLGVPVKIESIVGSHKVVLVRHEIDFINSAVLDDVLVMYTRMRRIGNSSFVVEEIMVRKKDNAPISRNIAYHAWLDPVTGRSMRVPDEFRKTVRELEGKRPRLPKNR